jgi:hypothetical protein
VEEDFGDDCEETLNANPHEPLSQDKLLPARSMIIQSNNMGNNLQEEVAKGN